jgi:hypothetical protein
MCKSACLFSLIITEDTENALKITPDHSKLYKNLTAALPFKFANKTLIYYNLFPDICNIRVPKLAFNLYKAHTAFASSNTGTVGSNPTRVMDVCVGVFCVCVVLFVDSGLATG